MSDEEVIRVGHWYARDAWVKDATQGYDPGDCWTVWHKSSSDGGIAITNHGDLDELIEMLSEVRKRLRTSAQVDASRAILSKRRSP